MGQLFLRAHAAPYRDIQAMRIGGMGERADQIDHPATDTLLFGGDHGEVRCMGDLFGSRQLVGIAAKATSIAWSEQAATGDIAVRFRMLEGRWLRGGLIHRCWRR